MKQSVKVAESIMSRYEDRSREEMIALMDHALDSIPEASRAGARFGIDIENFAYDESDYPRLFLNYARPETDEEEAKREAMERDRQAYQDARDKAEFARLSAVFSQKK